MRRTSDFNDAFVVANKDNLNEFVAWSSGDGDASSLPCPEDSTG